MRRRTRVAILFRRAAEIANFLGLDVGSWSQWVSALLTSASVLLALYIILRDRRAVRRKQISRLIIRYNRTRLAKRQYRDDITFSNRSDDDFTIGSVSARTYDPANLPFRKELLVKILRLLIASRKHYGDPRPRWLVHRAQRYQVKLAIQHGGFDSLWLKDPNDEDGRSLSQISSGQSAACKFELSHYEEEGRRAFLVVDFQDAAGIFWTAEGRTGNRFEGAKYAQSYIYKRLPFQL